jgi:hypothetical protein
LPINTHSGTLNEFSVVRQVSETSPELIGFDFLTTGIKQAFAASGDITTQVLPKSSMHRNGKYLLL